MQIETALLIQGPLHQNTVLNVKANSCFAEILVSTWPPTDECQEEVMRQLKALGVRLIVNEMGAEKTMRCPPIIAHQTLTTLRGLELVKSKRVIKSRSDEWYELSGLADLLAQNPTRIVFSNFIVRPWAYHPYHVSDHLYGGGTEVLVNAFRAISVTDKEEFIEHLGPTHVQVAESLIGWMLFRSQVKSSPQASQDLLDFGVRPQSTPVWRTFMNLFQLYDLQKIEGKFECHARRAGVGPVTNLRTLVREHRQWGLVLDFVH
jgi:hypothetical protein